MPPHLPRAGTRRSRSAPSKIRVAVDLGLGAGMRHRALLGVADRLGVAPQRARLVLVLARLPRLLALGQLGVAELDIERARLGVDRDHVAVLQERDRSADRGLRPDMADAEAS